MLDPGAVASKPGCAPMPFWARLIATLCFVFRPLGASKQCAVRPISWIASAPKRPRCKTMLWTSSWPAIWIGARCCARAAGSDWAVPLLGGLLGVDLLSARDARAPQGKADATIRVAAPLPSGAIEPVTVANSGGGLMLMQTGEFLAIDQPNLVLKPWLALSWTPNDDGSVWTFKLRPDVKFHNGHVLNADDVVATMDRLANPKNGSNALSAFRGVLSLGGTRKVDDLTVAFHLDAPNGNFPYIVSSDNYNAIILPADYAGDFEKNFKRHRSVQAREIHAQGRRQLCPQPGLLGTEGVAGAHGIHLLRRPAATGAGIAGRPGGRDQHPRRARCAGHDQRSGREADQAARRHAPRRAHAHRRAEIRRQARPGRRSR